MPNIRSGVCRLLALLLAARLAAPHSCAAAVHDVTTRDELLAALAAAQPGDEIRLAPGTYPGGIHHAGLRGTTDAPIVIAAADPANPPRIEGGQTTLHLSSPEHVELSGLVLADAIGNGLNIDDSGSTDTPARHVVLRDLAVRDIGPDGNSDGVKLSGVEGFQLSECRVERWGRGGSGVDMVGCQRGVIERCRLLGSGGQGANAIQTKGGSSDIVIRRCRIENPGARGVNIGGSTGDSFFRPRDAAYEARNITVEDCEFLGGDAAVAFVGVDGATVRHNTIYRPRRWPLRILQESTADRFVACRNGKVTDNVIAFRSDEVREAVNIGPGTEPKSFQFARNLWACLDRPAATERLIRLPVSEEQGTYGEPPAFADADNGDLTIQNHPTDAPGVRSEDDQPNAD